MNTKFLENIDEYCKSKYGRVPSFEVVRATVVTKSGQTYFGVIELDHESYIAVETETVFVGETIQTKKSVMIDINCIESIGFDKSNLDLTCDGV